MAVTATPKLDALKLRADFPFLEELVNGKPVAFLDSAASTQKPRQVLDAMVELYSHSYANVHRGVYRLAERATDAYEGARGKVAEFVNAPSEREVIFTRQATEALNLVAYAWGLDNLGEGDLVVVSELEHHSNFVPWQYIAGRTGAAFRTIPIDDNGELRLDALDGIAAEGRVKAVATGLVSNTLGTVNPVEKLAAWAHEQGAIMVVDAATSSRSRRTRCSARRVSAPSGAAASCSRRCPPSTWAGT
jgi:cysteine desulfurase / selenocysteine lyase